jgi:FolB domain-containing protein
MDTIVIRDLEVRFRVGVPNEERAQPQPLTITVELDLDTAQAASTDDLAHTIDYFALSRRIKELGAGREWRLIEKLAADVATLAMSDPRVQAARVEVRKFILPDTRYVAVRAERRR